MKGQLIRLMLFARLAHHITSHPVGPFLFISFACSCKLWLRPIKSYFKSANETERLNADKIRDLFGEWCDGLWGHDMPKWRHFGVSSSLAKSKQQQQQQWSPSHRNGGVMTCSLTFRRHMAADFMFADQIASFSLILLCLSCYSGNNN